MSDLRKICANWCFFTIAPDILSVRDATLQPSGIGVLEVLEEDVGVGDVVDGACCVGGGSHVIESDKPLFEVEQRQDYPTISVAKMSQVGQCD